ncbi:MAG: hypothetical protein IJ806_03930 [Ruminococcus sp.]|nr:hypothetical protein [Ruminococcus sp.]
MAIYYKYSGDPKLSNSYLYGDHWKNDIGYYIVQGKSQYNHIFGGETWKLPICNNCHTSYHQLFNFDLRDPKLAFISDTLYNIPLIGCLNCSESWETFYYSINNNFVITELHTNDTQHWIQNEELQIPVPLPKIQINLIKMTENDIPTDENKYYDVLNIFGKNSICRLIGAPLYLQTPIDYECPKCKKKMMYIATVCSEKKSHFIDYGLNFDIGDAYYYYMFCDNCKIVKCEMQSL